MFDPFPNPDAKNQLTPKYAGCSYTTTPSFNITWNDVVKSLIGSTCDASDEKTIDALLPGRTTNSKPGGISSEKGAENIDEGRD